MFNYVYFKYYLLLCKQLFAFIKKKNNLLL